MNMYYVYVYIYRRDNKYSFTNQAVVFLLLRSGEIHKFFTRINCNHEHPLNCRILFTELLILTFIDYSTT